MLRWSRVSKNRGQGGVREKPCILSLEQRLKSPPEIDGARGTHDAGAVSEVRLKNAGGNRIRLRPLNLSVDGGVIGKVEDAGSLDHGHLTFDHSASRRPRCALHSDLIADFHDCVLQDSKPGAA
jgi:hypothetical protein